MNHADVKADRATVIYNQGGAPIVSVDGGHTSSSHTGHLPASTQQGQRGGAMSLQPFVGLALLGGAVYVGVHWVEHAMAAIGGVVMVIGGLWYLRSNRGQS